MAKVCNDKLEVSSYVLELECTTNIPKLKIFISVASSVSVLQPTLFLNTSLTLKIATFDSSSLRTSFHIKSVVSYARLSETEHLTFLLIILIIWLIY